MIFVELLENQAGEPAGLTVTGHALAAPYGQDIVCAAVSVIVQTALLGLQYYLSTEIPYHMAEGEFSLTLPEELTPQEREYATVILKTAFFGLESTAASYDRYLTIKRRWI